LPADHPKDPSLIEVGSLVREEMDRIVVAYQFDLTTNELATTTVPNPNRGRLHRFTAYRLDGDPVAPVRIKGPQTIEETVQQIQESTDDDS
jgi:hypothetical protein